MTDFQELILIAVEGLGDEAHSRAVREAIEKATEKRVSISSFYLNIQKLCEMEYLIYRDSEELYPERGMRPRRYYTVTPQGRRAKAEGQAKSFRTLNWA